MPGLTPVRRSAAEPVHADLTFASSDRSQPSSGRAVYGRAVHERGRAGGRVRIRPDYDEDPERFRLARRVLGEHALAGDVHERVARRLLAERLTPALDVGCGEGELARHLPRGDWVGIDSSPAMLARAPRPAALGEATALPFPEASFDSVALLYVLYHLEGPSRARRGSPRAAPRGGSWPSRPRVAATPPSSPTRFRAPR